MLHDRDYMYDSPPPHGGRPTGNSVIMPLIWANIIAYILQTMTDQHLTAYLGLNAYYIARGQVWRLATYMFAHGGFGHILFNMWGVYLFGRLLESRIGSRRFLHLYLASGITGGLAWLVFNWHPQIEPYRLYNHYLNFHGVVGASGGVFGIMIATAMMFPNQMIMLLFPPIPMKLKTFALVFGGIEVLQAISQGGGRIAHIAHLGGALAGYLYIRHYFRASWSPFDVFSNLMAAWSQKAAEKKRRGFKVHRNQDESPYDRSSLSQEVDRILDKVGNQGLQSLTKAERRTLEEARQRLRHL